jgi:hypothetical protein
MAAEEAELPPLPDPEVDAGKWVTKLPDTSGDGYTVANPAVEAAEAPLTDTSFSFLSCEWV